MDNNARVFASLIDINAPSFPNLIDNNVPSFPNLIDNNVSSFPNLIDNNARVQQRNVFSNNHDSFRPIEPVTVCSLSDRSKLSPLTPYIYVYIVLWKCYVGLW